MGLCVVEAELCATFAVLGIELRIGDGQKGEGCGRKWACVE